MGKVSIRETGILEASIRELSIWEASIREASIREAGIREVSIWEASIWEASIREAIINLQDTRDPRDINNKYLLRAIWPRRYENSLVNVLWIRGKYLAEVFFQADTRFFEYVVSTSYF